MVLDSQPSFEELTHCHALFCQCTMQFLSSMNSIKMNEDARDLEKCRGFSVHLILSLINSVARWEVGNCRRHVGNEKHEVKEKQ